MNAKDSDTPDLALEITRAMRSLVGGDSGDSDDRSYAAASDGCFGEIYAGVHPNFGNGKRRFWMYENADPVNLPRPSVWLRPMTSKPQSSRARDCCVALDPGWLPSLRADGSRTPQSWILLHLPSVTVNRPTFQNEYEFTRTLPVELVAEARRKLSQIRNERKARRQQVKHGWTEGSSRKRP